jgi:Peroxiredoxin
MARLAVGDKMPNLTVDTAYEAGTTVEKLVNGKKTVFWVLRYIGCTVCRYDVHLLIERYQEFKDKDAQVVVVMQSRPEKIQEDVREEMNGEKLPFDIICDTKFEFYNTLEILPAETMEELVGEDRTELNEKGAAARAAGFEHGEYEGNEQQLPGMFIVEGDMTVSFAHYGKNLMDMPKIDDVLAML